MRVDPSSIHECDACVYVASEDNIVVPKDATEKLNGRPDEPVFLGTFTMPDWTGHGHFYAVACHKCDVVIVDYPHGYSRDGSMFFEHLDCPAAESAPSGNKRTTIYIKDKSIYEREGIKDPREIAIELEKAIREQGFEAVDRGKGYTTWARDGRKAESSENQETITKKKPTPLAINVFLILFILAIVSMAVFYQKF